MGKDYLRRGWVHPNITTGPSQINETGIFATADFKEGEKIMIWGGVVINKKEYETSWPKYHNKSVIQIDGDNLLGLPIDEPETIDVYLNHSCDPNTWLIDEVTVVARRDIKAGEEITLDSATWNDDIGEEYSDEKDQACTCGSKQCRGRVTGNDWKLAEVQNKYSGHFSPYIQKRIEELRS